MADTLQGITARVRNLAVGGMKDVQQYVKARSTYTLISAALQFIGVVLLVVSQSISMVARKKLNDTEIDKEEADKRLKTAEILFWIGLALVFVGWIVALAGGFIQFKA